MQRVLVESVVVAVSLCLLPFLRDEPPSLPAENPLAWSLANWVGTRRDAATGQTVKLRVGVESILGGIGQIEHLEAQHRQGPYLGFTVRLRSEKTGKWSMTSWNSKRTHSAQLNGEVEATRSIWTSAAPNQVLQSRLVSEQMETKAWRRTMSISEDRGKSWRVLWVDELRRCR